MKIKSIYSHLNGEEWLMVRRRGVWKQIKSIVASVDASKCRTKASKEKTKTGKLLYAPKEMNARFAKAFEAAGWQESRVQYWVTDDHHLIRSTISLSPDEQRREIERAGRRPIYSYNQTDFLRDGVAVEIQFGKYSFIAYDLFVKHLAFYVGSKIDCGVEILPMKELQSEMSSGPGYYEAALYDLVRQGRGVPAVPLVLIGIAP